jgi:hypothetical protein
LGDRIEELLDLGELVVAPRRGLALEAVSVEGRLASTPLGSRTTSAIRLPFEA